MSERADGPIDMGWMSLPPDISGEPFAYTNLEQVERDGGIVVPAAQFDEFLENPEIGLIRRRPERVDPIAAWLRDERRRRHKREGLRSGRWSQRYVANRLGVVQPTVSQWELGTNLPRLPQLRAWAALFDLDVTLRPIAREVAA